MITTWVRNNILIFRGDETIIHAVTGKKCAIAVYAWIPFIFSWAFRNTLQQNLNNSIIRLIREFRLRNVGHFVLDKLYKYRKAGLVQRKTVANCCEADIVIVSGRFITL